MKFPSEFSTIHKIIVEQNVLDLNLLPCKCIEAVAHVDEEDWPVDDSFDEVCLQDEIMQGYDKQTVNIGIII